MIHEVWMARTLEKERFTYNFSSVGAASDPVYKIPPYEIRVFLTNFILVCKTR